MLRAETLTDYISGNLGANLIVKYKNSDFLCVVRHESNHFELAVPKEKGDQTGVFSIDEALSNPMCGAQYTVTNSGFHIVMESRHQIWAVLKIAIHHLSWHVDDLSIDFQ